MPCVRDGRSIDESRHIYDKALFILEWEENTYCPLPSINVNAQKFLPLFVIPNSFQLVYSMVEDLCNSSYLLATNEKRSHLVENSRYHY